MPDSAIAIPPWMLDKPIPIEPGRQGITELNWAIDTLGRMERWLNLTDSELVNAAQQHVWQALCNLSAEAGVYEAVAPDGKRRSDMIRNMSQVEGEHNLERMIGKFQIIADDPTTPQEVLETTRVARREAFHRLKQLKENPGQPKTPIVGKPPIRHT